MIGYTYYMQNLLPSTTQIGAVHLYASQPASLATFYQHTLGMDLLGEAGETLLLGVSGRPLLGIHPASQPKFSGRHTGLYHLAVVYPSRLSLARAFRRLVNLRSTLQGASDHGVSEAIYLTDPEGNGLELYYDRPPGEWPRTANGSVQMFTNPLDLEDLLSEDNAATSRPHVDPHIRVGHVHIHVAALTDSIHFYKNIIGFDVTQQYGESAAFVSAGGYHHHLAMNTWLGVGAPRPPQGSPGLAWFEIIGVPLTALRHRLEVMGWNFEEFPPGGLFTRDPSGNGVALLGE
jgi:catechol 2,3-dioxygenase